jgi:hypothetical protein
MNPIPVLEAKHRFQPLRIVIYVMVIPRAIFWVIGAILSCVIGGFIIGWRDGL